MNKLVNILVNPLSLALVVTLIIIPFLPQWFDKYKTELVDSDRIYLTNTFGNKTMVYYNDLDNDGKSEKIRWYIERKSKSTYFILFDNNDGVLSQINFLTDITVSNSILLFGDYDNNGLNEIYFFTRKNDSVFIQGVEPFSKTRGTYRYIKKMFVDTIWKKGYGGKYDAAIYYGKLFDLNNDNYKEVVFPIHTGFSLQPRNVYAYDLTNDTIIKSPESGSSPITTFCPVFYDLNNDGNIEIIGGSSATGNLPKDFPYSDNSAWLMVFDNKLNFFFEPVEFPLFNSRVIATPYKIKDETFIAVLYQYAGKENKKPALYLYNTKGEKVKEKIFAKENKNSYYYNIITLSSEERNRLYLYDKKGNIEQLNEELETIDQYKIENLFNCRFIKLDIDGDTEEELIFINEDKQKLIITRNDFSHPITVNIPNNKAGHLTATVKLNGDENPNLSVQLGENWYLFNYIPNPLYYFKYLIYLGIYIGLFLFLYLTQRLRYMQLEREKRILEKKVDVKTKQLQEKNVEITKQKEVIEEKNKDITASIRYAKRIQNAILTSDEYLTNALNQHFVLFKPKDVVSGDFYWAYHTNNEVIYIAADCTGHGVPGAFMSMIGNSLLNGIIIEKGITEADKILNELRQALINTLGQTGASGEARDGMDASVCVWHKDTNKLEFAGANNPLYLVRTDVANTKLCQNENVKFFENDLAEIKGDKQPIGYEEGKEEPFTKNEIQLQKDDTIYIFSDGYRDQYGGKMNKKFMAKRFRQLFIDIQGKSMQEQKEILNKTIEDWKGDVEQVDDILVIGVRI